MPPFKLDAVYSPTADQPKAIEALAKGIEAGEFDVPNATVGRDLMTGTVLATVRTTLRGRRPEPRVVAHHLLRALGVPDARAKEIAERPLPEIVAPK